MITILGAFTNINLFLRKQHIDFWQELRNLLIRYCSPRSWKGIAWQCPGSDRIMVLATWNFFMRNWYFKISHRTSSLFNLKISIFSSTYSCFFFLDKVRKSQYMPHLEPVWPLFKHIPSHHPWPQSTTCPAAPVKIRAIPTGRNPQPGKKRGLPQLQLLRATQRGQRKLWCPQ